MKKHDFSVDLFRPISRPARGSTILVTIDNAGAQGTTMRIKVTHVRGIGGGVLRVYGCRIEVGEKL